MSDEQKLTPLEKLQCKAHGVTEDWLLQKHRQVAGAVTNTLDWADTLAKHLQPDSHGKFLDVVHGKGDPVSQAEYDRALDGWRRDLIERTAQQMELPNPPASPGKPLTGKQRRALKRDSKK